MEKLFNLLSLLFLVASLCLLTWMIADIYWWKIKNITRGADPKEIKQAEKSTAESSKGILPALKSTESVPKWDMLYKHAQIAQIQPETMRHMLRLDLEYLAGMAYPHPDLEKPLREDDEKDEDFRKRVKEGREKLTKLMGNVNRANAEISRRNGWRIAIFTSTISFVAISAAAILRK